MEGMRGLMMEGMTSPALIADLHKSQKAIKERIWIGMSVPERTLVAELKERGVSEGAVRKEVERRGAEGERREHAGGEAQRGESRERGGEERQG
eukprot:3624571-Rhodomonas_salina.1